MLQKAFKGLIKQFGPFQIRYKQPFKFSENIKAFVLYESARFYSIIGPEKKSHTKR
jgi:hypothetical protein